MLGSPHSHIKPTIRTPLTPAQTVPLGPLDPLDRTTAVLKLDQAVLNPVHQTQSSTDTVPPQTQTSPHQTVPPPVPSTSPPVLH